MAPKISPYKATRMMALYFQGYSQTAIANKLDINQATVSQYLSKLKSLAEQHGLQAAAEEYGMMDQIDSLHALASELKQSKLSVEEARATLKVKVVLQQTGVTPEDYKYLIQACTQLKSKGLIDQAVKLQKLEQITGMTHQNIVDQAANKYQEMKKFQAELQTLVKKTAAANEELASIESQKKMASQDLEAHMYKVGVDSERLKLVEDLALALKEGGISSEALQDYIQRQQLLNEAGIALDTFVSIIDEAKVATSQDQGKELLQLLSDYGSLRAANKAVHSQVQSLQKEAQGLEKQAKMKQKLEGEVGGLKAEKSILEGELAKLHGQKDALYEIKSEVAALTEKKAVLMDDTARLEKRRLSLTDEIKIREAKLSDLEELELRRDSVSANLTEIEARIDHEKTRWAIYESFLGLVGTGSIAEMEKFAEVLPNLLTEVRQGTYSPQLLLDHILKNLNGHALQVLKCTGCAMRFTVDKPPKLGKSHCPSCGSSYAVVVDQDALETLRKALGIGQEYSVTLIKQPKQEDAEGE